MTNASFRVLWSATHRLWEICILLTFESIGARDKWCQVKICPRQHRSTEFNMSKRRSLRGVQMPLKTRL